MKLLCSYCGKEYGEKPGKGESHGICPDCIPGVEKEMEDIENGKMGNKIQPDVQGLVKEKIRDKGGNMELKKEDAKAVRKLTDILLISGDRGLKRGATTELHKMGYPVRTVSEVLDLNRAAVSGEMTSGQFLGGL